MTHTQNAENPDYAQGPFVLATNRGERLVSHCFRVEDPGGFHLRPASLLARTAQKYTADIMVSKKGEYAVDGKSIIGLLTLVVLCGDEFVVTAEGDDAAEAVSAIERVLGCRLVADGNCSVP